MFCLAVCRLLASMMSVSIHRVAFGSDCLERFALICAGLFGQDVHIFFFRVGSNPQVRVQRLPCLNKLC